MTTGLTVACAKSSWSCPLLKLPQSQRVMPKDGLAILIDLLGHANGLCLSFFLQCLQLFPSSLYIPFCNSRGVDEIEIKVLQTQLVQAFFDRLSSTLFLDSTPFGCNPERITRQTAFLNSLTYFLFVMINYSPSSMSRLMWKESGL